MGARVIPSYLICYPAGGAESTASIARDTRSINA